MSEGPIYALAPEKGIEALNKRISELEAEVARLRLRRASGSDHALGESEMLRTLEERQRLAVDAGAVGLWDWDIENDRVVWSERVYEFHGLTPTTFGGTAGDFQRLIHPEDAERVGKAITAAVQDGQPYDVEFRVVHPDGKIRWLSTKAQVIRDDRGRALRMLGATQDITAARQAQQELLQLQSAALHMAAIVESSDDAIVSKDLSGIITSWNLGAERIFGYTAEEVIGKPIVILIPPDRLEEEPEILRRLQRGQRVDHFETIRKRKDGTLLNISLTISPVRNPAGRIIGASKIARDITLQKRAEEAFERSNRDLLRANQDLETFAYSASHDLQEPLRMIAISAQLLERKAGDLSEENKYFLRGILDGAGRMQTLLEDLLSYTRATRQEEGPVPVVDSGKVLDQILQHLKPSLDLNHARVFASQLPSVALHEVHLTQLFQNLIGNALKYRGAKDPYVQISAIENDGCTVFSVSDNGLGIDPRFGDQIFGLFKRLHTREEYPGSGIGLAICKRIVEQYGGRIWLERSAPGAGSVFCFSLPSRQAPQELNPEQQAQTRRIAVWLVEDSATDAFVIGEALRHCRIPFDLTVLTDGDAALVLLQRVEAGDLTAIPDLVLLDLNLPKVPGIEVLATLRKSRSCGSVPVVVVTSSDSASDMKAIEELGVTSYFRKPHSLDAFMSLSEVIKGALPRVG